MKSIQTHNFSQVPVAKGQRSSFNRSHKYLSAFDAGKLIPFYCDEALPGDTHTMKLNAFGRLATPIHPLMDNLKMSTFFFAVPYRLLWTNFERFCGAQDDPTDSIDFTIPEVTVPAGGHAEQSIYDYMGIPPSKDTFSHNALIPRAYNLIWNSWFRDQNLQDSVTVNTDDGPDLDTDCVLLNRGKRHDYFTACLPWSQKGDSINMPLGDTANVLGLGIKSEGTPALFSSVRTSDDAEGNMTGWQATSGVPSGAETNLIVAEGTADFPGIYADLTNASAASINDFRQAILIQALIERDARSGTRYKEVILAHFQVNVPDYRVQRPEYLGGGSSPITVSVVPQSSASDTQPTPQGNVSGYGTVGIQNGFTKSFDEHCILLGLVVVDADLTYQKGLDRMWSRQTRYDHYWPALAGLGEQAVLNKEIFLSEDVDIDDAVFGYLPRYDEYRNKLSLLTGRMRSDNSLSLDPWHLSEDYSTLPVLDSTFIESNPPVDRVIAVPAQPHIIFDAYLQLISARPMPTYGVPSMSDKF